MHTPALFPFPKAARGIRVPRTGAFPYEDGVVCKLLYSSARKSFDGKADLNRAINTDLLTFSPTLRQIGFVGFTAVARIFNPKACRQELLPGRSPWPKGFWRTVKYPQVFNPGSAGIGESNDQTSLCLDFRGSPSSRWWE